jgi:pyruvate/2-oxoglutarate dehydrogenase complex dihydrolipoamide acyltransferase (E2) component
MVRRNAGLALVRFGDASGHDEVVALLQAYELPAPAAGVLDQRLQSGDTVNPGTMVGRIQAADGEMEIRSEVPGTLERWLVNEGVSVTAGQGIASLAPDHAAVWEALRALVLIGRTDDLPLIERYVNRFSDTPEAIQLQARETARAIRDRAAKSE